MFQDLHDRILVILKNHVNPVTTGPLFQNISCSKIRLTSGLTIGVPLR
jgi:hypothetical protein